MKTSTIILTLAVVAVLTAPTSVLAQRWPGGGPGWHGDPMGGDHLGFFQRGLPRMADELGLSDEQLEEIQSIVESARPAIEAYIEQLRESREAYRAVNDDPTVFNEGAFRAHAAAQNEIQTNLMVVVGQTKAEAFKVLTPEQVAKFQELRGSYGKNSNRRGGGRRSAS